ncbi:STAS domain-containing protein [Nannocystaceae bacterium ST9]
MISDEILRESISRLEQALAVERTRREEAEGTLAGIRCIVDAPDLAATDALLLAGLQPLLRYRSAAVLVRDVDDPESFVATHADLPALAALRWRVGPLLQRVLAGQVVGLYDIRRAPELATLAEDPDIRSALCVPLSTAERPALLLGVHPEPAFFSQRHVTLARGFSQTASHVLESLGAREHLHHRRLAEQQAGALARVNEALREQLATIQSQRQQIRRLSAPILQVGPSVLVVPLIGELDHDALVHVTETLLHAIGDRRARNVILDFTGFDSTDLGVLDRLQSLVRAAALLGARCRITGVRPRLATLLADATLEVSAHATLADALAAILH